LGPSHGGIVSQHCAASALFRRIPLASFSCLPVDAGLSTRPDNNEKNNENIKNTKNRLIFLAISYSSHLFNKLMII